VPHSGTIYATKALRSGSKETHLSFLSRRERGSGGEDPLAGQVVRYRFGDNAELMGAWESARDVAGPFQTKNEPQSGAGGSETPKAA
jgi:hypothetical protein